MSDEETIAAAGRALGTPVERARRVAGGDINDAWQLRLADGTEAFLKSRPSARDGESLTFVIPFSVNWISSA